MTRTVSTTVPADPDTVFGVITDIERLPEWNDAMTAVVEYPGALDDGAEWVVAFRALGQRWQSRSTLVHLDQETRRFAHRSCTDDGNPSWADWTWQVTDHPAGSQVHVSWDLHPTTFWRRVLLARIRDRQLARSEVPASLASLGRLFTGSDRQSS